MNFTYLHIYYIFIVLSILFICITSLIISEVIIYFLDMVILENYNNTYKNTYNNYYYKNYLNNDTFTLLNNYSRIY